MCLLILVDGPCDVTLAPLFPIDTPPPPTHPSLLGIGGCAWDAAWAPANGAPPSIRRRPISARLPFSLQRRSIRTLQTLQTPLHPQPAIFDALPPSIMNFCRVNLMKYQFRKKNKYIYPSSLGVVLINSLDWKGEGLDIIWQLVNLKIEPQRPADAAMTTMQMRERVTWLTVGGQQSQPSRSSPGQRASGWLSHPFPRIPASGGADARIGDWWRHPAPNMKFDWIPSIQWFFLLLLLLLSLSLFLSFFFSLEVSIVSNIRILKTKQPKNPSTDPGTEILEIKVDYLLRRDYQKKENNPSVDEPLTVIRGNWSVGCDGMLISPPPSSSPQAPPQAPPLAEYVGRETGIFPEMSAL